MVELVKERSFDQPYSCSSIIIDYLLLDHQSRYGLSQRIVMDLGSTQNTTKYTSHLLLFLDVVDQSLAMLDYLHRLRISSNY